MLHLANHTNAKPFSGFENIPQKHNKKRENQLRTSQVLKVTSYQLHFTVNAHLLYTC